MSNILTDAEEEITRTAEEAARAVAAADAGEIASARSLAESWEKDAKKAEASRNRWRGGALLEAALVAGGVIALSVVR